MGFIRGKCLALFKERKLEQNRASNDQAHELLTAEETTPAPHNTVTVEVTLWGHRGHREHYCLVLPEPRAMSGLGGGAPSEPGDGRR